MVRQYPKSNYTPNNHVVRGRTAIALRRRRRRRARLDLEFHWLARPKLGNESGNHIHWGVGIYNRATGQYVGVFHTTPELGDHLTDLLGFGAGLQVFRYYYPVAPGAADRLFERALNPQPWSLFRNCQHCATYILSGYAHSPTLDGAVMTLVGVAALGIFVASLEQPTHRPRRRSSR